MNQNMFPLIRACCVGVAISLGGFSGAAFATRTGGTDVVVSSISQNAANFSASITTDATGSGNYRLHFFIRLSSAPTGVVLEGTTPPTVPINGNATTTFTFALNSGLLCGTAYEVVGGYSDDVDGAPRFTVNAGAFTGFTTSACTVPGAPTAVTPTASNAGASVAFTAPSSTGGAPISAYTVTCTSSDGGATGSVSGAASPLWVGGLTNGKTYTCTVKATNIAGDSAASAASSSFVPQPPQPIPTLSALMMTLLGGLLSLSGFAVRRNMN